MTFARCALPDAPGALGALVALRERVLHVLHATVRALLR